MVTHPSILLIEDSPGQCKIFRLALAQTGLDIVLCTEVKTARESLYLAKQRYKLGLDTVVERRSWRSQSRRRKPGWRTRNTITRLPR